MDPITLFVIIALAGGAWFFFRGSGHRTRDADCVPKALADLGNEYAVLSGVVLTSPEGMIRLDHVILSPYGVFVILEVRETGRLECRVNDMDWPLKGGMPLHNPVWRNRKQVNLLSEKLPGLRLFGIVVIVNARLVGNPGPEVVRFEGLVKKLQSYRRQLIDPQQMEQGLQALTTK